MGFTEAFALNLKDGGVDGVLLSCRLDCGFRVVRRKLDD
jgi:hypothetical protein